MGNNLLLDLRPTFNPETRDLSLSLNDVSVNHLLQDVGTKTIQLPIGSWSGLTCTVEECHF